MEILQIRIMRGPNYWSNYRKKVIVAKIDIGKYEELPTNKIDGFSERLEALMPSLYEHRCSEGCRGGFFQRVKGGTWLGHVIEHIALELQTLAGMECGYGRTRSSSKKGTYHVIFSYEVEDAGIYAAHAAVNMVTALANGAAYDINADLEELKRIKKSDAFGPSTLSIVNEAVKRKIPYKRINNGSMVIFGQGVHQKTIVATMTSNTSGLGIELAGDKEDTKDLLARSYVPVAPSATIVDEEDLTEAIGELGFPLVIKPINGNHGRGVTVNIVSHEDALKAFYLAKEISRIVIVEKFVKGTDFRLLVVNNKLVAAAKRTPAMVTGDGISTIAQLIDEVNRHPSRGDGHENALTKISVDEITANILKTNGLTLNSILPAGQILFLKDTANISTGGTAKDITDAIHPNNVFLAERIAKLVNLDICGIDIVANDLSQPLTIENGAVIEVNAAPGFRMHLQPSEGLARNVAAPVMDMLFPKGSQSRIPLVAVTGTNGKTTTTRLIAHLAKMAGHKVGYTTSDAIYIKGHPVHYGDCSGPRSAETVLLDPTVDFAVLECARGGILKSGLGFDNCDISIVTNISSDHLGLGDINTLKDMANVKAVVARSTTSSGYSILNADDDLVYGIADDLDCNIALFSVDPESERIKRHCAEGGIAAILYNGNIVLREGNFSTIIEHVENIPLTFDGRAQCMIKNLLAAVLAAHLQGFEISVLKEGLKSFSPCPENMPGRMNMFKFRNFSIMLDYAHNPGGFAEMKSFLDNTTASEKIGILAVIGDRLDVDNRQMGALAAQMFDRIIIRQDRDPRGKTYDQLAQLITDGVHQVKPNFPLLRIDNELEALQHAMENAPKDALIIMCVDDVYRCIEFVRSAQQNDVKQLPLLTNLSIAS